MGSMDWLTPPVPAQRALRGDAAATPDRARDYPLESPPTGARALLAMLRYRAGVVAAGTAIGVAAAAYFAFQDLPVYRATAVVRLADARSAVVRGLEGDQSDRPVRSSDPLLSKLQLITSRGLIGTVVDQQGLRVTLSAGWVPDLPIKDASTDAGAPPDVLQLSFGDAAYAVRNRGGDSTAAAYGAPVMLGGVRLTVATRPDAPSATLAVLTREAAIDSVLANVRVAPRAETDVVDVSFIGPDPAVAQRVVNGLSAAFAAADVDGAQEQSRRRRVFLEKQLRETDAALAEAQRALDAYRRGQPAFNSREQMIAQQNALVALDIRREEITADRRMGETLLTRIEASRGAGGAQDFHALVASPEVSGNPVVAQLLQKLVQYQATRDSLTTGDWRSSATSPEVERLNQLITSTQAQVVNAVRSQITALDARVGSLTELRGRLAASAVLPSQESREARLTEQAAASRQISDEIRQEYQKARMAEAAEVGQVQVMDWAALPDRPMESMRSLKLGLGLFLGLLLGAGGATLREATDGSVRRREEVESRLQLPVLSVIPRVVGGPGLGAREAAGAITPSSGSVAVASRATPLRNAVARRWIVPREERSLAAAREAHRILRNNLAWAAGATAPPTTIVVTSATAGEGKTTTAVSLALGYVREGKSTLLLDCDFRRPRLHDVFRIAQSPGLGQLLLGYATLPSVVRAAHQPGLSVIPAGDLAADAFDGVNAERFRDMLQKLAGRYERIVIDTPPVLAVADAAMLAALGDGVVVVVRAGTTERVAVEQALRQLSFVNARIMGIVLNDAAGELERYGGYAPEASYGANVG